MAAVSVAGRIQPGILRRCLKCVYRENGLAARLLMAFPPKRRKQWTEASIPAETEAEMAAVFDGLYALDFDFDDVGQPQPVIIGLTPAAKKVWIDCYNRHNSEQANLEGDLAAAWSKLECYVPRFALIFHYIRVVAGDPSRSAHDVVDEKSVMAAIELVHWFCNETRRIYAMLDESELDKGRRELVEKIRQKEGSLTARELMRSTRRYQTMEEAQSALDDLANHGFGRWEWSTRTSRGGRPTRRLVLTDVDADTTSENDDKKTGSVDGSSVNIPDDEWGEL
jgi:hypothetical protein